MLIFIPLIPFKDPESAMDDPGRPPEIERAVLAAIRIVTPARIERIMSVMRRNLLQRWCKLKNIRMLILKFPAGQSEVFQPSQRAVLSLVATGFNPWIESQKIFQAPEKGAARGSFALTSVTPGVT
jgi:hypothetical protein